MSFIFLSCRVFCLFLSTVDGNQELRFTLILYIVKRFQVAIPLITSAAVSRTIRWIVDALVQAVHIGSVFSCDLANRLAGVAEKGGERLRSDHLNVPSINFHSRAVASFLWTIWRVVETILLAPRFHSSQLLESRCWHAHLIAHDEGEDVVGLWGKRRKGGVV